MSLRSSSVTSRCPMFPSAQFVSMNFVIDGGFATRVRNERRRVRIGRIVVRARPGRDDDDRDAKSPGRAVGPGRRRDVIVPAARVVPGDDHRRILIVVARRRRRRAGSARSRDRSSRPSPGRPRSAYPRDRNPARWASQRRLAASRQFAMSLRILPDGVTTLRLQSGP